MRSHLAVRLGILALPAAALAALATTPLRGEIVMPTEDGPAFAAAVTTTNWEIYTSTIMNVTVWTAFGVLALAQWLAPQAPRKRVFYGAAWSLAGILVILPILGIMALAWPSLGQQVAAGNDGALVAARATVEDGTWLVWTAFSLIAYALGSALLGWGLWSAGLRWAGAAYAIGGVAASLPFWFPVEMLGIALLTASSIVIAWRVWMTQPQPTDVATAK